MDKAIEGLRPHELLEHELKSWKGSGGGHIVACSSGTAALHLALESLHLQRGSKVLVPDYTMIACARAVSLAGLVPVFLDCKEDLLMDPDLIEEALTYGTKSDGGRHLTISAVMPVHVYGRSCNMPAIIDVAKKYDLKVIEDLAEAHGVAPHPETDAACWSFYKNKIVAGYEGGAIAFRGKGPSLSAMCLRSMGFTAVHDYSHIPRGHNYRMSDIHASVILASLVRYEERVQARRSVEMAWDSLCPDEWKMPRRDAPWVYDIRVPYLSGDSQTRIVQRLRSEGIEARHGFKPMSEQPEYEFCRRVFTGDWRAGRLSREVLYLPLEPLPATKMRRAFAVIADLSKAP